MCASRIQRCSRVCKIYLHRGIMYKKVICVRDSWLIFICNFDYSRVYNKFALQFTKFHVKSRQRENSCKLIDTEEKKKKESKRRFMRALRLIVAIVKINKVILISDAVSDNVRKYVRYRYQKWSSGTAKYNKRTSLSGFAFNEYRSVDVLAAKLPSKKRSTRENCSFRWEYHKDNKEPNPFPFCAQCPSAVIKKMNEFVLTLISALAQRARAHDFIWRPL